MGDDELDDLPDFSQYLDGDGAAEGIPDAMADLLRAALEDEVADPRHGLKVVPSPEDQQGLEALAAKLQHHKAEGSDGFFSLLGKPRTLLHEGEVMKKGTEARIKRTTKRHLVLCNDVLMVLEPKKGDHLVLKQVVDLTDAVVEDKRWDAERVGEFSFAVVTPQRSFHFLALSEEELEEWLLQLKIAIFGIRRDKLGGNEGRATTESVKSICWQHEAFRGTMWSAALLEMETIEIIDGLLQKGSDVNARDEQGRTALHFAAYAGNLGGIEALLGAGADVDALSDDLDSPLHYAAMCNQVNAMEALLEAGADVQLKNMDDRSPLFVSILSAEASNAALRILSLLKLQGADVNEVDTAGETGLHLCARAGYPHLIGVQSGLGANANVRRTSDGRTPIHTAASVTAPDPEALRALLYAGARPNMVDGNGKDTITILLSKKREEDIAKKAAHRRASEGEAGPVAAVQAGPLEQGEGDDGAISEEWVMMMLHPLLELVKHGARPSESTALELPEVARELIAASAEHWEAAKAPEDLLTYLPHLRPRVAQNLWVDDHDSDVCHCCPARFSMTYRRHHCRYCGSLVCQGCSRKKVTMLGEEPGSPPEEVRVCDGCFNEIMGRYERATEAGADVLRLQKHLEAEQRRNAVEEKGNDNAAEEESGLRRLLRTIDEKQREEAQTNAGKADALSGTMAQNMNLLNERGEKLERLQDRTANLQSEP
mmetsp:Transcript_27649/g.87653  ORF Transcript_27649/g.87653 Transcript_27649/m.87653 type:complete len:714 (-) Transcript_27649:107-2248(-)